MKYKIFKGLQRAKPLKFKKSSLVRHLGIFLPVIKVVAMLSGCYGTLISLVPPPTKVVGVVSEGGGGVLILVPQPNTEQLSPGMTIVDQLTANLTAKTRIFD